MSGRARRRIAIGRLAAAAIAAVSVEISAAHACNYHDTVGLSQGILNWVYPDSLHVRTAVSMAQNAGLLPRRKSSPGAQKLLGYHKAVSLLKRFNDQLGETEKAQANAPAFSLLFFEAMLWSRFAETATGTGVSPHTSGPQTGDVVVITDEPVIDAILDGRLAPSQARRLGLVRLYGKHEAVVALSDWFDRLAPLKASGIE